MGSKEVDMTERLSVYSVNVGVVIISIVNYGYHAIMVLFTDFSF